jgi:hypothetical protein
VGHGQANKRRESAIGLTRERLVEEDRPGMSPVSGAGGAAKARARELKRREDRGWAQPHAPREASMWPREDARRAPELGGSAEGRARRRRSGGGRGNSGSGDRAAQLDQQATRGAFVVHKEGLRSLRG